MYLTLKQYVFPNCLCKIRKIIGYITLFSFMWSQSVCAMDPLQLLDERKQPASLRNYQGKENDVISPGSLYQNIAHNYFEDFQAPPGTKVTFKGQSEAQAIFNHVYSQNATQLSGVIKNEFSLPLVFSNSKGFKVTNFKVRKVSSLILTAGGMADSNHGIAYTIDEGLIHFQKTSLSKKGPSNIALSGRRIEVVDSKISPPASLDITVGQHLGIFSSLDSLHHPQAYALEFLETSCKSIAIDKKSTLKAGQIRLRSFDEGSKISCHGLIQSTEEDIYILGRGDIYISKVLAAKNLHIETTGSVIIGKDSYVGGTLTIKATDIQIEKDLVVNGKGYLQASGLLNLNGKIDFQDSLYLRAGDETNILGTTSCRQLELESDRVFIQEKLTAFAGASLNVNSLGNKGELSLFGVGLEGKIGSLTNEGKIDLSHLKATISITKNKQNGAIRTRNNFFLQGDNYTNAGKVFTCGAHETTLSGYYKDSGFFYGPSLFRINAKSVEFFDNHKAFIKEGLLDASWDMRVGPNVTLQLSNDRTPYFLQLSSQGNLSYEGRIEQYANRKSFPLEEFFRMFGEESKKIKIQSLNEEIEEVITKLWTSLRKDLAFGVTLSAGKDLSCRGAYIHPESGTVSLAAEGKTSIDKARIKSGYFKGNHAFIKGQKAFLENSDLISFSGNASVVGSDCVSLSQSKVKGYNGALVTAPHVRVEEKSLVKSLQGNSIVRGTSTVSVTDSKVIAQAGAYIIGEASSKVTVKNSLLKGNDLSLLKGETIEAQSSQIESKKKSQIVGTNGNLYHVDVNGIETQVEFENMLTLDSAKFWGEINKVTSSQIRAVVCKTQGTTSFEAINKIELRDLTSQDVFAAKAKDIEISGKNEGDTIHLKGDTLKNNDEIHTKTHLSMEANVLSNLGKAKSDATAYVEAKERYTDTQDSLLEATTLEFLAEKTDDFNGNIKAKNAALKIGRMDFSKVLKHVDAENLDLHLKGKVKPTTDLTILPNLVLHASDLENDVNITALGNFSAFLEETLLNTNTIDIHGVGYLDAPHSFTNLHEIQGRQGLGVKTKGLLTHKGIFSGGVGHLQVEAYRIDAAAESLHKRSIFLGDTVYAYSESDFIARGAILRAREGAFIANGLLDLGAYIETFSSEEYESSFFGLNKKTTHRTWQEGVIFDASCTEKLNLHSKTDYVRGAGASLSSPFLKVHGEKGVSLNALHLARTEEVRKSRPSFEILGIDLFNPTEDGLPTPKLSVEVGWREQTTRTNQAYGVLGNINANHFEISSGCTGIGDLQGSHLSTQRMVVKTSCLKLGGTAFETKVEDHKSKFTAGIAFMGAIVPTASFSVNSSTDRIHSVQSAQVTIGHLENHYDGLQIFGSNGIQGAINSSSGKSFNARVEHTQTVVSQGGFSCNGSFSGESCSLGGGGRWGEKRSSEGTAFDIINAPNMTSREDCRYDDTDTRAGFNLSVGFSSSGSTSPSFGGSFQVKDQTFSFNTKLIQSWQEKPADGANFLTTARNTLERGESIVTGVTNTLSAFNLAGVSTPELHGTLNDVNSGLRSAQQIMSGLSQIFPIWDANSSANESEIEFSEQSIDELETEIAPKAVISKTQNRSLASVSPTHIYENSRNHEKEQVRIDEVVKPSDDFIQSTCDPLSENCVVVSLNSNDFILDPKSFSHVAETTYVFLPEEQVHELTNQDNLGLMYGINPLGFLSLTKEAPQDISQGFVSDDLHFVRLYSLPSAQLQRKHIAEDAMEFGSTFMKGCASGMTSTFFLDGGPQASAVIPSSCFIGGGKELIQTYVPRFTGEASYHLMQSFGASERTSEFMQQGTEQLVAFMLNNIEKPTVVYSSKPEEKSTLLARDYFKNHPKIESTGKLGAVRHKGIEISAVRDLSHIPNEYLEKMAKKGVAPYDIQGRPLQMHHHGQQDHRLEGAKLISIPKNFHSLGNTKQHSTGIHQGIGHEARKDFTNLRREFYREHARQELLNRKGK